MQPVPILITGASGTIGRLLVLRLAASGALVRAAVRDPSRLRLPPGAESCRLDLRDPTTFASALEGVRALFLLRPPDMAKVGEFRPFLEAARSARVERIVFLSLLGAEHNAWVPHAGIERLVDALGFERTFLRASFFMENLTVAHADDIRDGELFVPAGNGRTSFVAGDDVAAMAAHALLVDAPPRALDVTGPEALTYDEVAEILSSVLGRQVVYRRSSLTRFVRRMRARKTPWPFVLVMAGIYTTARFGMAGRISDDLPRTLGRPALAFRDWAVAHTFAWATPVTACR